MRKIESLFLTSNVDDWLMNTHQPRVLHVFGHAINLVNEHRDVLSVVTSQIGNGSFNLVVDDDILFSEHLDVESAISIFEGRLQIGDLTISVKKAKRWNPRPNWKNLYEKKDDIARQLTQLPFIQYPISTLQPSTALSAALAIADISVSLDTVQKLAGLGVGLTPSGDDFIMGALYAAWIIHPVEVASPLAKEIVKNASALTTSLSAAYLKSAGRGEAGILWHNFFDALLKAQDIQLPVSEFLSLGETSGADALSGFFGVISAFKELARTNVI